MGEYTGACMADCRHLPLVAWTAAAANRTAEITPALSPGANSDVCLPASNVVVRPVSVCGWLRLTDSLGLEFAGIQSHTGVATMPGL